MFKFSMVINANRLSALNASKWYFKPGGRGGARKGRATCLLVLRILGQLFIRGSYKYARGEALPYNAIGPMINDPLSHAAFRLFCLLSALSHVNTRPGMVSLVSLWCFDSFTNPPPPLPQRQSIITNHILFRMP